MNRAFIVALISLSSLPATGAQAQDSYMVYRGGFLGIAVGPSKMSFTSDSVQAGNGTAGTLTTEGSNTAFKGYGGYRFDKHFAVEGGLASLGRFTATRIYTAPSAGTLKADVTVIGTYVDAVGILPLEEQFEVFVKGGFMVTRTVADLTTTGAITTTNGATTAVAIRTGPHFGVGMEARFAPKVGLMLEYDEVVGVGDAKTTGAGNIGAGYVGLTFRF